MVGQSKSKHNQICPDININTCTIRNDIDIYHTREGALENTVRNVLMINYT